MRDERDKLTELPEPWDEDTLYASTVEEEDAKISWLNEHPDELPPWQSDAPPRPEAARAEPRDAPLPPSSKTRSEAIVEAAIAKVRMEPVAISLPPDPPPPPPPVISRHELLMNPELRELVPGRLGLPRSPRLKGWYDE